MSETFHLSDLLRRAKVKSRRAFARTLSVASDLSISIARSTRQTVPGRFLPRPVPHPIGDELPAMPLPGAPGMARWLGISASGGNDASSRSHDRMLFVIGDEAGTTTGWQPENLAKSLRERAIASDERPHSIVMTDGPLEKSFRTFLGKLSGVRILETVDPTTARAVVGLVSALALPGDRSWLYDSGAIESDTLGLIALSAGIPIVAFGSDENWRLTASEVVESQWGMSAREASREARKLALAHFGRADSSEIRWNWAARETAGLRTNARPQRIVVAGHDLKFAQSTIQLLRSRGHAVAIDDWQGHRLHDAQKSAALARNADTVWCEWTLGNAAWYSRNLRPGTRLVTRMHLQEMATRFPDEVLWHRVDAAVFVAEHLRQQALRDLPIVGDRAFTVPNAVRTDLVSTADPGQLDRRFSLGMVGVAPARKGLHVALDALRILRARDDRFTLSLRGRRPDELPWLMERPAERAYFSNLEARIARDEVLRTGISWSPFGDDMSDWYQRVGFVLSTSDYESFHFTLPDGAVNGAVPLSLRWPGSDLLYPTSWLHTSAESMAENIFEIAGNPELWRSRVQEARAVIENAYAEAEVTERLAGVIAG